jgi:hypothetical protein
MMQSPLAAVRLSFRTLPLRGPYASAPWSTVAINPSGADFRALPGLAVASSSKHAARYPATLTAVHFEGGVFSESPIPA